MTRLRDFGVTPGRLPAGSDNAITDVQGVKVGHTTLIKGEGKLVEGEGPVRTGVTAVLAHGGNLYREKVAAAVIRSMASAKSWASSKSANAARWKCPSSSPAT